MRVIRVNYDSVPECPELTLEGYLEHHSLMCWATEQASEFDKFGVTMYSGVWPVGTAINSDVFCCGWTT